jgi:hypothetical protein
MFCVNGEQMQIEGETGIFFICNKGDYCGNHCRFVRWCSRLQHYVMIEGKSYCENFSLVKEDGEGEIPSPK